MRMWRRGMRRRMIGEDGVSKEEEREERDNWGNGGHG